MAIGRAAGVPVLDDLGSGALADPTRVRAAARAGRRDRVSAGADLVSFSGDKLLGGPQAGRRRRPAGADRRGCAAHPLARALRVDKLRLAALAATLRLHRDAPDLAAALPTLRWLTRPLAEMDALGPSDRAAPGGRARAGAHRRRWSSRRARSAAVPRRRRSCRAARSSSSHPTRSADELAARFRAATPPVLGRIHEGRFLLDLRGIVVAEDLVPAFPEAG